MTVLADLEEQTLSPERQALLRRMNAINAQACVVFDPAGTHELLRDKVRQLMREKGVTPEDNIGSRELLRMRYSDDFESKRVLR